MSSGDSSNVELSTKCLCGTQSFVASVPRTSLPLQGMCCHCTSCRHVTGALYSSFVPWPGSVEEVQNSSLSSYALSATLDLLFCGKCSGPLFWRRQHDSRPETLNAFTGPLENISEPYVVSMANHIFVGDTIDGGASPWLRFLNADGTESKRWRGDSGLEQLTSDWPAITDLMKVDAKTCQDVYPIQCHCKGVDLVLRRGDPDFAKMTKDELPFFIDPTTHKHITTFDACSFCRPMFGDDIIHWTFALLQHLDFASSAPTRGGRGFPKTAQDLKNAVASPTLDGRFGTLSMYSSSDDVQRYFCSRCSATIFYAVDDRPDLVDVAVGVLNAPEGARAESLLLWGLGSNVGGENTIRGGWRENYVAAAKKAAEEWRVRRGYPKTWRRIALENSQSK